MVILKFLSDAFRWNKGVGGIPTLRSLSVLKNAIELLILKDIISKLFNYVEKKMVTSKFWLDVFGEILGMVGGLAAL